MPNDLRFVESIANDLRTHGLDVWLAGGWAEELHGMIEPRSHHDVDLLVRAESFTAVDRFFAQDRIAEINEKRFAHKRAFEADGTMVELLLIDPALTTTFWGEHPYRWPTDTFDDRSGTPRLASIAALQHYRTNRPPKQPAAR